jgi:hypothetical protein
VCAKHAAVEGVAGVVLALLDEDDGVAALRELAAHDGAAGAGADDDDVALDHVVALPGGGAVDLREVAGALEVLDGLEAAALRLVDVLLVEVGELEEGREAVHGSAQDGGAVPGAQEGLLAGGVELVEGAAGREHRGAVEEAHGGAEGHQGRGVEDADDVLGAEDGALVRGGDLRGAGEDGLRERERGPELRGRQRGARGGRDVEIDRGSGGGRGLLAGRGVLRGRLSDVRDGARGVRLEDFEVHGGGSGDARGAESATARRIS